MLPSDAAVLVLASVHVFTPCLTGSNPLGWPMALIVRRLIYKTLTPAMQLLRTVADVTELLMANDDDVSPTPDMRPYSYAGKLLQNLQVAVTS